MVLPAVALLVFVATGVLGEPPVVTPPAAQYTVPSFDSSSSGTYTNGASAYSTLPNPGTVNQTLNVQSPYYQQYQHQESPKPSAARVFLTSTEQASYGPPAASSSGVQLLQSENIFKAQAPASLGSGAERSFFYSPKESVVYQVTKIPVSQVPGLANALPVAQAVYEAPINGMMPPVDTSYGVPAQSYGVPVTTSYGVPAAAPVGTSYGVPAAAPVGGTSYGVPAAAPVVSYMSPVVTTTTTTYKLPSTHSYGAPVKIGGHKKKNKYFFKFGGLKLRYERPTVYHGVPNYYPQQTSTSYGAPVVALKPLRS